jgi:uncharacterized repeat protein (TIGR03803 family)
MLALAIGLAMCFGFSARASAQTLTVLHSFAGGTSDGSKPYGGLADVKGTFYGTTSAGGEHGHGVVFKVTSGKKETLLHSFQGYPADGAAPGYMNLIANSKGTLFGTTGYGGDGPCKPNGEEGCGTIFQITTAGKEEVLYSFQYGPNDGAGPDGTMVMDSAGNLYGTTLGGGNLATVCSSNDDGCGTVFEYTTAGKESVLYKFCPDPAAKCPDGVGPSGVLVRDASGNLYGTTVGGGAHGDGTVFKVTTSGEETVLYSFCAKKNCTDGYGPMGGLALDATTGMLYGTTITGGAGVCGQVTTGGGTLFEITTSGIKFKVLHSFGTYAADGCEPYGGPTLDSKGNIYGTTLAGGESNALGTVYEYSASGTESILYSFPLNDDENGVLPTDALIDSTGTLYGTTSGAGADNDGIVFKLIP